MGSRLYSTQGYLNSSGLNSSYCYCFTTAEWTTIASCGLTMCSTKYTGAVAFYKSIYAPDKVVNALCELFPAMRMNWELLRKNKQLYYPLYYGSADGVRSILKAQRWKIKEYKLFGAIKIAVLKYNDFEKELKIFGIPVFVIKH